MSDDPKATRRRLAAAQSALDLDPANVELITLVRHLTCAAEALEGWQALQHLALRGALLLDAHERRN